MLKFSEEKLRQQLTTMSKAATAAFALACAERVAIAYKNSCAASPIADDAEFESMRNAAWLRIERQNSDALAEDISKCESKIDLYSERQPIALAEDAWASLAYALCFQQTGDPQEAAWAARRMYETLDTYVIDVIGVDVNEIGANIRVTSHPIIQRELMRQQRDVKELSAGTVTIAEIRARASQEASTFLFLSHQ